MSNDLNQCNFIGRLGKDVEVRYQTSGAAIASFSIAVGSAWKDGQGEKHEKTEWVNVTTFGKLGEICEKYLHKGSRVFISGRMQTDKYEKDGITRYATKVIAAQMQMLDSKPAQSANAEPEQAQPAIDDQFDDDIPF